MYCMKENIETSSLPYLPGLCVEAYLSRPVLLIHPVELRNMSGQQVYGQL